MHRLSVAGEMGQLAFDDAALDMVQSASAGIPRLINLICDRGLMIGAQSDARVITAQMIAAGVGSLGLERPRRRFRFSWPGLPELLSLFRWRRPV
jgi:general secretion pathway protein A